MSDIIDLDALIPKPVKVKWANAEITVNPPKVHTVLRIADYWQTTRLAAVISEKELIEAVDNLKAEIIKCVPELEGQDLSYAQVTALVEILTKMSLPPEKAEMDKQGISMGDPQDPKGQSDS